MHSIRKKKDSDYTIYAKIFNIIHNMLIKREKLKNMFHSVFNKETSIDMKLSTDIHSVNIIWN